MRFIVRAVPSRAHLHKYLRDRLPDADWVMDLERRGFLHGLVSAFEVQGEDDAVHLEDDVILTQDFQAKVDGLTSVWSGEVIQMFSQRKADLEVGSRWDSGGTFVNTQCFYVPGADAAELAAWIPEWAETERQKRLADLGIAAWLKTQGRRYRIYVPSLVQHRDEPSAVSRHHVSSRWHSPSFIDPWE